MIVMTSDPPHAHTARWIVFLVVHFSTVQYNTIQYNTLTFLVNIALAAIGANGLAQFGIQNWRPRIAGRVNAGSTHAGEHRDIGNPIRRYSGCCSYVGTIATRGTRMILLKALTPRTRHGGGNGGLPTKIGIGVCDLSRSSSSSSSNGVCGLY